jgi:hypothetical protein
MPTQYKAIIVRKPVDKGKDLLDLYLYANRVDSEDKHVKCYGRIHFMYGDADDSGKRTLNSVNTSSLSMDGTEVLGRVCARLDLETLAIAAHKLPKEHINKQRELANTFDVMALALICINCSVTDNTPDY